MRWRLSSIVVAASSMALRSLAMRCFSSPHSCLKPWVFCCSSASSCSTACRSPVFSSRCLRSSVSANAASCRATFASLLKRPAASLAFTPRSTNCRSRAPPCWSSDRTRVEIDLMGPWGQASREERSERQSEEAVEAVEEEEDDDDEEEEDMVWGLVLVRVGVGGWREGWGGMGPRGRERRGGEVRRGRGEKSSKSSHTENGCFKLGDGPKEK